MSVVDEAIEDGVGIEILWGERRGNGTIVAAIEPMRVPHATGQ
jgi:hypothetical protein